MDMSNLTSGKSNIERSMDVPRRVFGISLKLQTHVAVIAVMLSVVPLAESAEHPPYRRIYESGTPACLGTDAPPTGASAVGGSIERSRAGGVHKKRQARGP